VSSAWRNALAGCAVMAMTGGAAVGDPRDPTAEYDGRFVFTRIRYGAAVDFASGRFRREPTWAHDFPRAEYNFLKILSELTFVPSVVNQGNIRTLDDPDLAKFPIAYMSEPGFWAMNDAEIAGLRNYLLKGGFIIFDDFEGDGHWRNMTAQMAKALPDHHFIPITVEHAIFHSFFDIQTLDVPHPSVNVIPSYRAIFEDNDPSKRMIALANWNNDLAEYWEWSAEGLYNPDPTNDAYRLGVNYIVYAMTH
jgi:hypothetical protein